MTLLPKNAQVLSALTIFLSFINIRVECHSSYFSSHSSSSSAANSNKNPQYSDHHEISGLKFCHESKVYKVRMDQCPGGLLLKPAFKDLPDCICSHGVFLHKSSGSDQPYDGIIRNHQFHCYEYKITRFSDWNLFLPLTKHDSPFDESVTIIPYEPKTDRMDFFHQRRYRIEDLLQPDSTPAKERIQREKIFYVGARKESDAIYNDFDKENQTEIQIGNLCLQKKLRWKTGVYVSDFEPTGKIRDDENVTYRVGKNCEDGTTIVELQDEQKIYGYSNYVRRQCKIPKTCISSPNTVLERPDLSVPALDESVLQRLARGADCNTLIEESVQLAEYFTRLHHHQIDGYRSKSPYLRMLSAAVDVFKEAVGSKMVPHKFINQIYKYFFYLYFDKEPPGDARGGKGIKTGENFATDLIYALGQCKLNTRELLFGFTSGECPAHFDYYKQYQSFGSYEKLKPNLTEDQKFVDGQHDAIPEAMWKVVNFAYNLCHKFFDVRLNQREFFKVEMTKLFMTEELQQRWKMGNCPQITSIMQYKSILPYGDLNLFMENLDIALATSQIDAPEENWIERPIEKKRRKKRSLLNYENYEIWDGKAYCLQTKDYPEESNGILPDINRIFN